MDTAAFENDSILTLLTDALRRGPGSPQWHDAVQRLRGDGIAGADEMRLLMTVRERLAAGQHYREVRAGPGFTRDLFEKLDAAERDAAAAKNFSGVSPSAWVAMVSAVLLIIAAGYGIFALTRSPANDTTTSLATRIFATPVHAWAFTDGLPKDWVATGTLKLSAPRSIGLVVQRDAERGAATLTGPGIDTSAGVCVEAEVTYQPGPTSVSFLIQSDSTAKADSLEFNCNASGIRVSDGKGNVLFERPMAAGRHTLRWRLLPTQAVAELDGQVLWQGAGVGGSAEMVLSFNRSGKANNEATIRSLRVLRP